jgi:ribosomal protein S18 acetylase RimI-like enzyme
MVFDKTEILTLAKTLFVPAEWPYITSYLETMLPKESKVLHVDGQLAAFVIVNNTDSGNAFISYCGVSAEHQGKGYGSKLLKETLISIFQVDYHAVRLYVDCWNKDALRLYTRLGFKQIGLAHVAGSDCLLLELTRADYFAALHTSVPKITKHAIALSA